MEKFKTDPNKIQIGFKDHLIPIKSSILSERVNKIHYQITLLL